MSRNVTMAGRLRDAHREPGMSNPFFDRPILNSPYEYPRRYWELDDDGQPTQKIIDDRRDAKFITPIPKSKKRKIPTQAGFVFDEGKGLSTKEQQYDPTSIINGGRQGNRPTAAFGRRSTAAARPVRQRSKTPCLSPARGEALLRRQRVTPRALPPAPAPAPPPPRAAPCDPVHSPERG
jgi:hypothetical protein